MVDLSVMTSASNYTYVPANHHQTLGLTSHRHTQLPSAAMQNNNLSMPPAWQSRNAPYYDDQQHDASVRSFGDIALDPLRFITATKFRKSVLGITIATLVLTLLF